MKFIVFASFLSLSLLQSDSFITKYEYGAYLYDNPRAIGCNKCHGNKAQGMLIARYKNSEKDENFIELRGSNIQKISINKLKKALQNPPTIMPKYNLTDQEIEALFTFLNEVE